MKLLFSLHRSVNKTMVMILYDVFTISTGNINQFRRSEITNLLFRAFHRFGQDKIPDGGSILGSILFSILPQLPPKILLGSKAFLIMLLL